MKSSELSILTLSAGLLLLAGCNNRQPEAAPSQAATNPSPAPAARANGSLDIPKEVITMTSLPSNSKSDVSHIVRKGTVIIWQAPFQFSILFNNEPPQICVEPHDKDFPEYYTAGPNSSSSTYKFQLQCTINVDDSKQQDLSYSIVDHPKKQVKKTVTHCEGCSEQTDPNAGQ